MTPSENWSLIVRLWSLAPGSPKQADFTPKPEWDEEDGKASRYRISWDAPVMATLPDSGADTLESGSSTRADANWDFGGPSGIIPELL
jgi:hypothetical protein